MQEWLHPCALLLAWSLTIALVFPREIKSDELPVLSSSAQKSASSAALANDLAKARQHWAYHPIVRPPLPVVRQTDRIASPIDTFIAFQLEKSGLTFSPRADRRTLIRRAYLDLIGLPPTYEETEAFVNDSAPDSYARLIDHLLASPRYGERWGRHWLDVARYAETKDFVLLFGKDRLQPYAYTYRDYVIRAINLDTPFNQFVEEQIAADQIEPKVEKWRLAALGFLTVGRLYDNNANDQIDDQIDTVSRGFLGLTVACARCHNHKYDAIPTEDYYSLYGVFASCHRPYELPLIEDPEKVVGGLEFEKKLAQARRNLEQHIDSQYQQLIEMTRQRIGDYLVRVATTKPDISETSTFFLSLSPEDLRPGLVFRWRRYLEQHAQKEDSVFGLWAQLMELPEEDLIGHHWKTALVETNSPTSFTNSTLLSSSAETIPVLKGRNSLVVAAFQNAQVSSKADVARVYGDLFRQVYERNRSRTNAATADDLPGPEHELLEILVGKESPCYFPKSNTPQHMARTEKDKYGSLVQELDKLAAYATNCPPARAMVLTDSPELCDPHVFIRGSAARQGKAVPRRFLRILGGDDREPFAHGSGRLDLAKAITAADNPLTSRVFVNRVWMHHFGEPLVNSPNDFGTRSEPPTHPELLDYLAWTFMHEGWSLKRLHRLMMLSETYQQSSFERPDGRKADPDNRLLWRANRHRLDFESMRDGILAVSGDLDLTMGGRSVDAIDPHSDRRTVYGLVDRQDLPAVFRVFDFACPDQSVERRPRTIVPQQALFAMNSPFVLDQARALARRVESESPSREEERAPGSGLGIEELRRKHLEHDVEEIYRLVLDRLPRTPETAQAVQFIRATEDESPDPNARVSGLEQFAQVLLMSNEFMFPD